MEDTGLTPALTWWLTIVYSSSPRALDALLSPSASSETPDVHRWTFRQNTPKHKKKDRKGAEKMYQEEGQCSLILFLFEGFRKECSI